MVDLINVTGVTIGRDQDTHVHREGRPRRAQEEDGGLHAREKACGRNQPFSHLYLQIPGPRIKPPRLWHVVTSKLIQELLLKKDNCCHLDYSKHSSPFAVCFHELETLTVDECPACKRQQDDTSGTWRP